MAKQPASSSTKLAQKPVKRARIEEPPSKQKTVRVKESPPPTKKQNAKRKESVKFDTDLPLSAKSKGKQKEDSSQSATAKNVSLPTGKFKIVAGSYEKLLYGLEGSTSLSESKETQFDLKPIFMFPAHVSCIKAVAASPGGKWLTTGSADEIIKVWDLRRKKEIGGLMHHEGSITQLHFASRSYLLSASEDGTLCLFHARDWSVLRSLKGHKTRVNCVAVHPSGKVALSVGKDRALRMWDLMRGKGVASTKLGKEGEIVRWSTDGSRFVVLSGSTVDVFDTVSPHHTFRIAARALTSLLQGNDPHSTRPTIHPVYMMLNSLSNVSIYDVPTDQDHPPQIIGKMVGHSNRNRNPLSVHPFERTRTLTSPKSTVIVSTVSSDGMIHVYDLAGLPADRKEVVELSPAAQYDTKGTRLTCVTLASDDAPSTPVSVGKRKRDDDENEDDENENEGGGEWGGVGDEGSEGSGDEEQEEQGEEEEEQVEEEQEVGEESE
ncbi:Protein mak11 [Marasmius tenuissimus]|uniref:Protein mak11 n=1 Tax=Marasmius tenuissimus TaxID=585030 RepID=A0ABR2ZFM0_9AGAR